MDGLLNDEREEPKLDLDDPNEELDERLEDGPASAAWETAASMRAAAKYRVRVMAKYVEIRNHL